jgi:hypothetical protein
MQPVRYVPTAAGVTVLTWPEASQEEFEALVGPENVNAIPGGIQVRGVGGEWFTLGSGWVAGIDDNGNTCMATAPAFAVRFRVAD